MTEESTQWLHSPVTEARRRLQPGRELSLRPYLGRRSKVKTIRTEILIGSAPGCDVQVFDSFVSPRHALLKLETGTGNSGGGYSVHDLSSRNGTYLNGVRVGSAPLPSEGVLVLGRSELSWGEPFSEEEVLAGGIVAADPLMRAVLENLRRVAGSPLPVLLLGETGTGKDALARILHAWSASPSGPYVPVNAAITGGSLAESELFGHRRGSFTGAESDRAGALRSAHGGTLFLDEIADIPPEAQVKLLRALESGEVKAVGSDKPERSLFRLVSATSRPLDARLRDGSFRLDLYYRLAGFVVRVPPLRERPQDIDAIARRLASERGVTIDENTLGLLRGHRWPGNVRELRATIERGAICARAAHSSRLRPEHLRELGGLRSPRHLQREEGRPATLAETEREQILAALNRNHWQRTNTALELGISRSALYEKMRRLGLMKPVIAPRGSE